MEGGMETRIVRVYYFYVNKEMSAGYHHQDCK